MSQQLERSRGRRQREPLLVIVTVVLALLAAAAVVVTRFPPARHPHGRPSAATPSLPATAQSTPPSLGAGGKPLAVPATGAYFGVYNNPRGEDRESALRRLEAEVDRRFDIDHTYYKWDQPFPTAYERWTSAQGRTPLINWVSRTQDGRQIKWSAIAAGQEDATIDQRADAVRDFGKPVLLVFQHEPGRLVGSGPGRAGSADDYRAAWRHIVTVFRERGATNVSFVWVLTAYNFRMAGTRAGRGPDTLYPGDDVIDWIGVDGYNYYNCPAFGRTPWRTFDQIFGPWYQWALPHHKPLAITEWGVQEDPANPGRKAQWYRDMIQAVRMKPEIKALVYFNSAPACPNWVDSTPQALSAFRAMADSSYFRPTP